MKTFKDYFIGTLLHPRRTFEALLTDERRLKFGLSAISINPILYTFVYIFLWHGRGAPSTLTPWLAIPKNVYYFYNQFMLAPSMACSVVGSWQQAWLTS